MLDALKELYISYPFMPVEDRPDLFTHIKDIRCVAEMPAANPISLVENDNYIRAWLIGLTSTTATVRIQCGQYGLTSEMPVPIYQASVGAPATNSYVLVDDAFVVPDGPILYELQPDTLIFMQTAPEILITVKKENEDYDPSDEDSLPYKMDTNILSGPTISTAYSQNVSITKGQSGIIIYGAPGAGLGVYTTVPTCYDWPTYMRGEGAISINGLSGYVRIDDAYPVDIIETFANQRMTLDIRNGEINNETH